MRWKALLAVVLLAAFVAVALLVRSLSSAPEADDGGLGLTPPGDNVILISIDTLRADHLGAYGYGPPTSPNLDRFRDEAVLFTQAIAHAPSTLPSHASMLTSRLPQHHGASYARGTALPPEVVTLAEVLSDDGFHSVSYNGGGQLAPIYGLDQGFEIYLPKAGPFGKVVDRTVDWLEEHRGEPFFLFLHTYEVHHPYKPRPKLLEIFDDGYAGELPDQISVELLEEVNRGDRVLGDADLAHIIATYDAEIRSMDRAFGRLEAYLRQAGLWHDTVVAFTSDHGEEFGEHGKVGWHSHTLYDELLRVPLMIKLAASAHGGDTVERQVRLIDLAPTLLAAVGRRSPEGFDGRSLLPLLAAQRSSERPAVSWLDSDGPGIESLRYKGWKLYQDHLFHLETDPGELHDVAGDNAQMRRRLARRLEKIVRSRDAADGEEVAPDEETLKHLRALGYLN
jgi:arylsulfatase A-like enzyme